MSVPEPIKRPSLVKKIQEKKLEKYTRGVAMGGDDSKNRYFINV